MGKGWPRYDSVSKIDMAVTEVDRALIDLRYSDFTSAAQMKRAMEAVSFLKTIANHCKYDHYDKIRELDRPRKEQEAR